MWNLPGGLYYAAATAFALALVVGYGLSLPTLVVGWEEREKGDWMYTLISHAATVACCNFALSILVPFTLWGGGNESFTGKWGEVLGVAAILALTIVSLLIALIWRAIERRGLRSQAA